MTGGFDSEGKWQAPESDPRSPLGRRERSRKESKTERSAGRLSESAWALCRVPGGATWVGQPESAASFP